MGIHTFLLVFQKLCYKYNIKRKNRQLQQTVFQNFSYFAYKLNPSGLILESVGAAIKSSA